MTILIMDIETTGFLNKGGKIVEVGAVELCLKTGNKKIVFNKVINPGLSAEKLEKTWIVENKYMTVNEINAGFTFESIKTELQELINKYPDGATAFHNKFDFEFLESYGIKFPVKLPCLMEKSKPICKLPPTAKMLHWGFDGFKSPKAQEAYDHFFGKTDYIELHRGADDAFHEADICFELHKLGKFIN